MTSAIMTSATDIMFRLLNKSCKHSVRHMLFRSVHTGLKGKAKDALHPASLGKDETADAVPFTPSLTDCFPDRPREVICELLGCGLKVDVASHNKLKSASLTDKLFVKRTRSLLAVCRNGQLRPNFAEGLHQNLVSKGGALITPLQLYRWGEKICDKTYAQNVKKRKQSTKLEVAAPTGFNTHEVALTMLHQTIESFLNVQRSIATLHLTMSDLERQLRCKRVTREERLRVLKAAWDPVSRISEESDVSTNSSIESTTISCREK